MPGAPWVKHRSVQHNPARCKAKTQADSINILAQVHALYSCNCAFLFLQLSQTMSRFIITIQVCSQWSHAVAHVRTPIKINGTWQIKLATIILCSTEMVKSTASIRLVSCPLYMHLSSVILNMYGINEPQIQPTHVNTTVHRLL